MGTRKLLVAEVEFGSKKRRDNIVALSAAELAADLFRYRVKCGKPVELINIEFKEIQVCRNVRSKNIRH